MQYTSNVLLEKKEELSTFLTSVIQTDGILEASIEFALLLAFCYGFVNSTWPTLW